MVQGTTRGGLGLSGDASARVDLLAQLDSNVKIVEAVSPACAEVGGQLRQLAWVAPMNAALQALNANKADDAARLAERAAFIYQGSPLPWYIMSNAAQAKGDMKGAEQHWTRIVQVAANDTAQQSRDIRASAMFNLAVHRRAGRPGRHGRGAEDAGRRRRGARARLPRRLPAARRRLAHAGDAGHRARPHRRQGRHPGELRPAARRAGQVRRPRADRRRASRRRRPGTPTTRRSCSPPRSSRTRISATRSTTWPRRT
jgi:hypothetical protein